MRTLISYLIAEFFTQSYVTEDLQLFFKQFSPKIVDQLPVLVSIDGGTVTADKATNFSINAESNLDFGYAMALTASQPVQLYQVGDKFENSSFTNMLEALDKSYCGQ